MENSNFSVQPLEYLLIVKRRRRQLFSLSSPFRFDRCCVPIWFVMFFFSPSQQLPVFNFISESEICIDPFSVRCFCRYHKIKLFRCNHRFVCGIRIMDAENHVECTYYNRYSWSYTVTVVAVFFDLLWII